MNENKAFHDSNSFSYYKEFKVNKQYGTVTQTHHQPLHIPGWRTTQQTVMNQTKCLMHHRSSHFAPWRPDWQTRLSIFKTHHAHVSRCYGRKRRCFVAITMCGGTPKAKQNNKKYAALQTTQKRIMMKKQVPPYMSSYTSLKVHSPETKHSRRSPSSFPVLNQRVLRLRKNCGCLELLYFVLPELGQKANDWLPNMSLIFFSVRKRSCLSFFGGGKGRWRDVRSILSLFSVHYTLSGSLHTSLH